MPSLSPDPTVTDSAAADEKMKEKMKTLIDPHSFGLCLPPMVPRPLTDVEVAHAVLRKYRECEPDLSINVEKLADRHSGAVFRVEIADRLALSSSGDIRRVILMTLMGMDLHEPHFVLWAIETILKDAGVEPVPIEVQRARHAQEQAAKNPHGHAEVGVGLEAVKVTSAEFIGKAVSVKQSTPDVKPEPPKTGDNAEVASPLLLEASTKKMVPKRVDNN
jgi:hypothetical protein